MFGGLPRPPGMQAQLLMYLHKELVTFLVGFIHLTLSFDGWLSKGHDEFYTVHITTPWP